MDLRRELLRLLYFAGVGPMAQTTPWRALQEADTLRALLQGERFYALGRTLDRIRSRDGDDRVLAVAALADWPAPALALDWWVGEASHRPEPWLARGIHRAAAAGARLRHGPPGVAGVASLHRYFQAVEQAERDFAEAARRDAADPEPYAWLLATALAAGAPGAEVDARFAAVCERDPRHLQAHVLRLRALGDDSVARPALDFARTVCDAVPRGHALHALIPCAYVESWAWTRYVHGPDTADALLRAPEVFAELAAAYHRSGLAGAEGPDAERGHRFAAGCFAVAFYLTGERPAARRALCQVGRWPSPYPWAYLEAHAREHLETGYVVDRLRRELSCAPAV